MDILLILQPLQDACINLSNEINTGLTYGDIKIDQVVKYLQHFV